MFLGWLPPDTGELTMSEGHENLQHILECELQRETRTVQCVCISVVSNKVPETRCDR